jgi:quercetin dioxygenase-like cupin family protein
MAEEDTRMRPRRPSAYKVWQQDEGIPVLGGTYVSSLYDAEVAPWSRLGQQGAFVNLADQEEDDGWIIEIAPGGQTEPVHHVFESTIFVLNGRGATTIWQEGKPKQTVEWQRGSLFSPPINAWYQHYNLDGQQPARLFCVTNAPMVMNIYRDPDFVFNVPWSFSARYDAQEDYFSNPGQHLGKRQWKTNYVSDTRGFQLDDYHERGAGGINMQINLANNQMQCHISEFPPGTYKMGHKHGAGAHVLILGGTGYSLLWFPGGEFERVDWRDGAVVTPKAMQFHQHFNSGPGSARYLALRLGALDHTGNESMVGDLPMSTISLREGGWQVDYEDEDPYVWDLFAAECRKNGAEVRLEHPLHPLEAAKA